MNGLSLHCGSNEVQRDQLALVPTPEATESWFPSRVTRNSARARRPGAFSTP